MRIKYKDPDINRFAAHIPNRKILIWNGPPGTVPLVAFDIQRADCESYQPTISLRRLAVGTEVLSHWGNQWHGAVVIEP